MPHGKVGVHYSKNRGLTSEVTMIKEETILKGGIYPKWIDRTDPLGILIQPVILILALWFVLAGYRATWFFGQLETVGYYDDHPGDQLCRP